MALSHAISYQNMSLHPPTPVPFLILKSAPCYSSFLGHGRFRAMARPPRVLSPEFSPQTWANYGESNLAKHHARFPSQIFHTDSSKRRN